MVDVFGGRSISPSSHCLIRVLQEEDPIPWLPAILTCIQSNAVDCRIAPANNISSSPWCPCSCSTNLLYIRDAGECQHDGALLGNTPCKLEGLALGFQLDLAILITKSTCNSLHTPNLVEDAPFSSHRQKYLLLCASKATVQQFLHLCPR